ncbi:hypothetical protein RB195_004552 [Necator americanus]|uniref:Mos1 transposase HTH domain-containing protein n=1 Tax=Necator americanus TaxID=51031 RepID=A0ABR1BMH1_NECAM
MDVISRSQCYKWFQRFENGNESLEDEEHRSRPQVVDDELLKKAIESDPTQTTRKLALEFGCSNSTIDEHLHTIGKTNRCGKWVPHKLSDENKAVRKSKKKFEELGWKVLPHPPYSLDLAPSDYHLFRSMHHGLSEKTFNNIDEVRSWVASYFDSQPTKFFEDGIHNLHDRWRSVVDSCGEYCLE